MTSSSDRSGSAAGLVLALESSPQRCSAALLRDGALLAERASRGGRHNAESLLPAVDAVLAEGEAELGALAGLAVAVGPGAFTSLRIAVATAKGLAFGSDLTAAPVSTLAAQARAVAELAEPGALVVAVLDARRDEAYAAGFELDAAGWPTPSPAVPESVYGLEQLAGRLPARCMLTGDAAGLFEGSLRDGLADGVRFVDPKPAPSLAFRVGELGARALAAGQGEPLAALAPRYLRRAEAEAIRMQEPLEAGVPRARDGL